MVSGHNAEVNLTSLQDGRLAKVKRIEGGRGLTERLESMGIRPGRIVRKIGSVFNRGPVAINMGSFEIALGFGMARRIIVEELADSEERIESERG